MPLEPLPVNRAPELIFGLVAPIGVDLDVVAELIDITLREMHYNAHVVRLTTLMRAMKITVPRDPNPDPLTPEQSHISSYKERIAHANAIRGELEITLLRHLLSAPFARSGLKSGNGEAHSLLMPQEAIRLTTRSIRSLSRHTLFGNSSGRKKYPSFVRSMDGNSY